MQGKVDSDIQISKEDQQNINNFSKLNQALKEKTTVLQKKKDLLDQYDDALTELEIMDDDEEVRVKFGDCFFNIQAPQATVFTEQHIKNEKEEATEISNACDQQEAELKKLKAILYTKFGKSINLEED